MVKAVLVALANAFAPGEAVHKPSFVQWWTGRCLKRLFALQKRIAIAL